MYTFSVHQTFYSSNFYLFFKGLANVTNDGNGTASLEYLNLIVESINATSSQQQQQKSDQSNL